MNCLACKSKSCRSTLSCGAEKFELSSSLNLYHEGENQEIIQKAAHLVDGGHAGTLSRVEELISFSLEMGYEKIGLAYCYGMEDLANEVRELFQNDGIKTIGVSCTVGGFSQDAVNEESELPGVSCNPLNQAAQLNKEGVDLAVVTGLCMGHDILFNREFKGDSTTLVVKDRPFHHAPVEGIKAAVRKLHKKGRIFSAVHRE